jgi:hypothetical protein
VNRPLCLALFLATKCRGIPAEDLTRLATKWGRSAALLGPPGRGFDLHGPHSQRLTVMTLV